MLKPKPLTQFLFIGLIDNGILSIVNLLLPFFEVVRVLLDFWLNRL